MHIWVHKINKRHFGYEIHRKLLVALPIGKPSWVAGKQWCRDFKTGSRDSCLPLPTSGRPRTSHTLGNVATIKEMIDENPRHYIRSLSISKDIVGTILEDDLDMRKLCSVWCQLYFLHDNARPHSSQETRAFMELRHMKTVYQAPYTRRTTTFSRDR